MHFILRLFKRIDQILLSYSPKKKSQVRKLSFLFWVVAAVFFSIYSWNKGYIEIGEEQPSYIPTHVEETLERRKNLVEANSVDLPPLKPLNTTYIRQPSLAKNASLLFGDLSNDFPRTLNKNHDQNKIYTDKHVRSLSVNQPQRRSEPQLETSPSLLFSTQGSTEASVKDKLLYTQDPKKEPKEGPGSRLRENLKENLKKDPAQSNAYRSRIKKEYTENPLIFTLPK